MRKLEPRSSRVDGPRTIVRLDVAELSLPVLMEGFAADRVWLEQEGDDLYALRATLSVGESRKQAGGPVAIDLLTDLMNELGDALDGDDVPQRLRDLWDSLVERYEARTSARKELSEHPGADTTHHDSARANPQDQTVKGEGPGAL